MPVDILMKKLRRKLLGYYQYYAITDNYTHADKFQDELKRCLFRWLNRRSQRRSFTWDKFILFIKQYQWPRPKANQIDIYQLRPELT